MPLFFIVYILLSIIIGLLGKNRKFGFWGYFFGSLLLSPLLGLLLLLASEKIGITAGIPGPRSNRLKSCASDRAVIAVRADDGAHTMFGFQYD